METEEVYFNLSCFNLSVFCIFTISLASCSLTVFQVQANNYASFYDEGRQSWSVMFDKEETITKFAKDVSLCAL